MTKLEKAIREDVLNGKSLDATDAAILLRWLDDDRRRVKTLERAMVNRRGVAA